MTKVCGKDPRLPTLSTKVSRSGALPWSFGAPVATMKEKNFLNAKKRVKKGAGEDSTQAQGGFSKHSIEPGID